MENKKVEVYQPEQIIFREGEPAKVMYILLSGTVDLKKKVEKGEKVLKTVDTPNDFFGEMSLIDDRPRSATAVATKATKLLTVDEVSFENIILTNGKFALKVIKVLSERIRNSNIQITELKETGLKERIQRGMTDFAILRGEKIFSGALKISIEAMTEWMNSHLGIQRSDIDNQLFRLLKDETVQYAPTSAKTKDCIVLSEEFIRTYDRRG